MVFPAHLVSEMYPQDFMFVEGNKSRNYMICFDTILSYLLLKKRRNIAQLLRAAVKIHGFPQFRTVRRHKFLIDSEVG